MTVEEYYNTIVRNEESADDYELFSYRPSFFIGFDKEGYLCVVIQSSSSMQCPIMQKTKLLSVECNRKIEYSSDGSTSEIVVHIVKCFSRVEKERILFLELIDATIIDGASDEEVMDVFSILCRFFADKNEPSDAELIGLYAEIDAIVEFSSNINLGDYWQSKDRMKFDFSFSDTHKLEVKATTKSFRTHHFRHEQLMTNMYTVFVLSYMLRYDDEGVSLYDLLYRVKPLLVHSPKKLIKIDRVIKNTSEERLKNLRFNQEYTRKKRHFYLAKSIPKFVETTPDGVANAEYDCNLDNLPFVTDEFFLSTVMQAISEEAYTNE